ncbi:MAG: TatD family hydrolase [Fimbriimonas sp.]
MRNNSDLLIDTHCHLNDPVAFPDPASDIAEAQEARVEQLLVVGTEPSGWHRAIELAETFSQVHAIIGWHPNYTTYYKGTAELEILLKHPKVVALGEIGLDYHWDYATPEQQKAALSDQLALAKRLEIPVVFHCREAYPDLLDLLEAQELHRYLFHCFAGDMNDARRAIALGAYFGVDGPITYKKADDLREVIASIPQDRLVIETDSPYMPPVPFRGKPNKPAYVKFVNDGLAQTVGLTPEACAQLTTENAKRFFSLP